MKRKVRLFAALLPALLCMLLSAVPALAFDADAETVHLSTAEDVTAFSQACRLDSWSRGKTVVLDNDIDLQGVELSAIPSFGGRFDGQGYALRNLSLSETLSTAGLFRLLEETGSIENLTVTGTVTAGEDCSAAGGIAGVSSGSIKNCVFEGSLTGASCTGGIVGRNLARGTVEGCRAAGSISGTTMTGGIAGYNAGTLCSCDNEASVNTAVQEESLSLSSLSLSAESSDYRSDSLSAGVTDTGGIAGYSAGVVDSCSNSGAVGYQHLGYNTGGIVGRSSGQIISCSNTGTLNGRKDVGGIVGQVEPYIATVLSETVVTDLAEQLEQLNQLVDRTAADAGGTVAGASSRFDDLTEEIRDALTEAARLKTELQLYEAKGISKEETESSATYEGPGISLGVESSGGDSVTVELETGSLTVDSETGELSLETGSLSVTPEVDSLTQALNDIESRISLLNGSLSGTVGTLAEDLRAINAQFDTIAQTLSEGLAEAAESEGLISDGSLKDISLVTLGKISACRNTAAVNGDINVGGIAGSMAQEYELDPEDDLSADVSADTRRSYELKAILTDCTNAGLVTAKRNYAGGICGRMSLGLIDSCQSYGAVISQLGSYVGGICGLTQATIRSCYVRATLYGDRYVGGIVGTGTSESLTGGGSTVSGCVSMVALAGATQNYGAVSGAELGSYAENVFLSDTLSGIDGVSVSGRAEPISYEALKTREDLPAAMSMLALVFSADGRTLKTVLFSYGDSFTSDIYPKLPQKAGYSASWDVTELTDLHMDTAVTAVYTPLTESLASLYSRSDGRNLLYAEGSFKPDAVLTLEKQEAEDGPVTAEQDWQEAVKTLAQDTPWYRLLTASLPVSLREQWKLTLPEDGNDTHVLHFLLPERELLPLTLYIRQDGKWQKAETEKLGSYLLLTVSGSETELMVAETLPLWWVLLPALGLLLLLGGIILLKRARKALAVLTLLLLLGGGAAAAFLAFRKEDSVYSSLTALLEQESFGFTCSLDTDLDGENLSLSALQSSDALQAAESAADSRLPDGRKLLRRVRQLCTGKTSKTEEKQSRTLYTLKLTEAEQKKLCELCWPSLAEQSYELTRFLLTVTTDSEGNLSGLTLSAGMTVDREKQPRSLSVSISNISD